MLYDTSDMERTGGEAATAAMQGGTWHCCACLSWTHSVERFTQLLTVQAAAGRMLYDTSDMERTGGEAATAAMQEGTRRCCACHLRDLLPCLGGVAALLPLFAQLGEPKLHLERAPYA